LRDAHNVAIQRGLLITSGFTKPAVQIAERTDVELWDWEKVAQMFESTAGIMLEC